MGPQLGWLTGWAIVAADVDRDGHARLHRRPYTFLLFDCQSLADSTFSRSPSSPCIWIIIMTAICHDRDRALRPDAGLPARRGDPHAGPVRGCGAVQGLFRHHPAHPLNSVHIRCRLVQPVRPSRRVHRARRGRPARGVHLLGLGQRRLRQRGNRGLRHRPRQGDRVSTDPARLIYVIVTVAAQSYAGLGYLRANKDDVLSALGNERVRLAARQDPDHRGAHLRLGLDPDDDPADRANDAVDGPLRGRCRRRSGEVSSSLPHAPHLDHPDGGRHQWSGR